MSILDQIISSTDTRRGGPVIVSEQHDLNRINVEIPDFAAQTEAQIRRIESGAWDAREYGISREAAVARLRAADTPEARAKVIADLTERAKRRASLDVSNGRVNVMVAGKAPWHRLGVHVAEAVTSADAARLAGIDWLVEKTELKYVDPSGRERVADGVFAIVRQDTGAMLGSVGRFYTPVQNQDGFDFLDAVLEKFGAKYETAGAVFGGKKVWMQVHLPQQRFAVNGSDVVEPYAIFTNPHDGSGQAWCFPTTERVVCANTLRIASYGRSKGIGIRHTGNLKQRITEAQNTLGLAVSAIEQFADQAAVLARTPLPKPREYFDGVLDAVLDITAAEANKGADALLAAMQVTDAMKDLERKRLQGEIDKRRDLLDDMLTRYDSAKCGVNGMRGTAWAGLNAVTEHADHARRYIGGEDARESRRFESVLVGDADQMKQIALEKALDYTRA